VQAMKCLEAEDQRLKAARYEAWCEVGEELKLLRLQHRISLRHAAALMGISAPFLADMEGGKRAYSEKHIRRFEAVIIKEGGRS